MTTIVTRAGKGSALTHTELDANFTNLQTSVDAIVVPAAPLKIAVLGDSLTCNPGFGKNWPDMIASNLTRNGIDAEVYNVSQGGWTFYKAQTAGYEIFGTKTALDYLIELAPDMVIVSLGYNDTITVIDSRTIEQVEADADALFAAIQVALPDAYIVYAGELAYDEQNSPGTGTLKNKWVIPAVQTDMTDAVSGGTVAANLENNINATNQAKINNWQTLHEHILTNLAATIAAADYSALTIDLWKPTRLGLTQDGLHVTEAGQSWMAGYIWQHLTDVATVATRFPVLANLTEYNLFTDPVAFWADATDASGDGWTLASGSRYHEWLRTFSVDSYTAFANWYKLPTEAISPSISIPINSGTDTFALNLQNHTQPYTIRITGCEPNTTIQIKINAGAWSNLGSTDSWGRSTSISCAAATFKSLALGVGSHTIQYRVGKFTSQVFNIVLTDANEYTGPAHGRVKFASLTAGTNTSTLDTWAATGLTITVTPTGGKRLIRASVNVGVVNPDEATWINAGVSLRLKSGSTVLATWTNAYGNTVYSAAGGDVSITQTVAIEWLDTDTALGARTYTVEYMLGSASGTPTAYINGAGSRLSTISVTEVESLS